MFLHTNFQYKLIHIQSQISYYCGVFPFIWDPPTKTYKANKDALNNFILASIVCIFHYGFLCFTLIRSQLFSRKKLPLSDLYFLLIMFMALTLLHWDMFIFYCKKDELIALLNILKYHFTRVASKLP